MENPTVELIRKTYKEMGEILDTILNEENKVDFEKFFMGRVAFDAAHEVIQEELKTVYKSFYADLLYKYDQLKEKFG